MKNIMCFGDSNTHGANPTGGERFPWGVRWTSLLDDMLGKDYHVIEEGMGGRTIANDDYGLINMNGMKHIDVLLHTHNPLDLVIVMLGTNDLKERFALNENDIARNLSALITAIKRYSIISGKETEILVISPTSINSHLIDCDYFGNQDEKSKLLTVCFEKIAKEHNVYFDTLYGKIEPSSSDGLHIDQKDQVKVAQIICENINKIFKSK